jgi:hypothetical protein
MLDAYVATWTMAGDGMPTIVVQDLVIHDSTVHCSPPHTAARSTPWTSRPSGRRTATVYDIAAGDLAERHRNLGIGQLFAGAEFTGLPIAFRMYSPRSYHS